MTRGEMIGLLTERFYDGFADQVAARIVTAEDTAMLYGLVTAPDAELARNIRHAVRFRGAYVLERVYFGDPSRLAPFAERFCGEDFAACTDQSTRRHFGKIMAHLLGEYDPGVRVLEIVADAAAQWAVEPRSRVAVRIWAVEVLKCCRDRVGWVAECWDDVLEALSHDATPGIDSRLRKSWKKA